MRYLLTLLISITIQTSYSYGQNQVEEYIADGIKSVQLHREEWNLSYPLIYLDSGDRLVLKFDKLGDISNRYLYTFIHCDKNWIASDIYTTDYLEGFYENPVNDYKMSFNTAVNYINYSVTFPNEEISFKYSGNYIIKVYEMGEPENPIVVKRFMVSEKRVEIEPELQRSKLTSGYNTHQQVDFTVYHPGLRIQDPYRSIFATILQNGRWDNSRSDLQPDFIGNNTLVYNDLSGKNSFPGGAEFRYFDIKSVRYQTEFVKSVDFFEGRHHILLLPSETRAFRQYFYWQDFNGKYYTAIQEGRDHDIEADYLDVYFTLPSDFPVNGGDVYVFGALSDWKFNAENRMRYNNSDHRYELTLTLKQGWYNYIFVSARDDGTIMEDDRFESDHYETENDYIILIYLREPMDRYDRIIGSRIANTLNRQ